jgi:RHS repeat-associated protein
MTYANPHALTQLSSGYSTTTYVYDNKGNVIQKTTDGTTTTYVYDYANRLTALGVLGATTTYGYDWAGNRVYQTGTTTTYLYPFKWYSVASSTGTGAKFATTTDYVFNGDSLVATIDQQSASGNATGTAKTRYIHPDHLGSTNVVTDENGNVVQTLDFYPYGSTRISVATSTNERRQFIGQFTDDSTLSYLQARYYDSGRGQFLSEDPAVLAIGSPVEMNRLNQRDQATFLKDPQRLNMYSYAQDNPITNEDITGLASKLFGDDPVVTGLEDYGYYDLARQYYDLATKGPGGLTADQKAQIRFDTSLAAIGQLPTKFLQKSEASFLTIGGTALQGIDAYCINNICSNFAQSQNVSPAAILANLPQPSIQLTFSGIKYNSNVTPSYAPTRSNSNSVQQGASGGTGNGGATLVGLYQSLVSKLTALVRALTTKSP